VNLTPALTFLVEYLNLPEAVGDPDAIWETFQLEHLNNPSLLAIEQKARQVGWSWMAAAESVATAILYKRTPHIFVSINQEEASEKIRYAKAVIEALDKEVRPRKLIIDNTFEIELSNGSRLISHPCRPPRGKSRAHVYLDEFAHYPNDRKIYQAALPILSKGGKIRIGSSPLGARGMFWEIYSEALRKYPGYVRVTIPWWVTISMSTDPDTATLEAPGMTTDERVYRFGTDRLIQLYENMPLEDFQQEYECEWLDETISWIDWELIKRNQVLAAEEKLWFRKAKGVDAGLMAINDVAEQVKRGHIEQTFVGGMDIGRTRDTTEIILLGDSRATNALPYRLHISLDRIEFDDQKAVVSKLLSTLPVTAFLIDRNGIGMDIAEKISASFPQAQGAGFTNATKELWAVEAKLRAQRAEVPIPLDRELAYQIHSIRRKITAAKNNQYDTEGNEKHHADMFWAWALAIWAGKSDGVTAATYGESPFADSRG
jgi:phage FluMu gp28-like protein